MEIVLKDVQIQQKLELNVMILVENVKKEIVHFLMDYVKEIVLMDILVKNVIKVVVLIVKNVII